MSNKESTGRKEHAFLMAENRELRRLWIENEADIIELKSALQRFLRLKWHQRLFIKWDDWQLHKDVKPIAQSSTNKQKG